MSKMKYISKNFCNILITVSKDTKQVKDAKLPINFGYFNYLVVYTKDELELIKKLKKDNEI